MSDNQLYDAARYYVDQLGFSVIPIINGDKRPAVPWTEYQNRKPTNEELVNWFYGHDHQLGVVCGKVSGNLVVLDFETPDAYAEWASRHPDEADTRTVTTGKGVHVYLRTTTPPDGNTKLVPNLVETRGEGGMVLAPPSLHPSGRHYQLRNGRKPVRTTTWADISRGEPWGERRKLDRERAAVTLAAGVQAGSRNDSLFEAAVLLRDGGKSADEALGVLLESNGRFDPPLERGEVERTVRSAFSKAPKPPRFQDASGAMAALAELKEQHEAYMMALIRNPHAPEPNWFELVKEIILTSQMTEDEVDAFLVEVEAPPSLLKRKKTALKNEWRETRNNQAAQQILNAANVERPPTWPYDIKGGRLVHLSERTVYDDAPLIVSNPIADFRAVVSHEITREGGEKLYVIDGCAIRGGPFSLEIAAEDYGSEQKLKAKLDAASGGLDPVRAKMGAHLGPAIKLLTKEGACKKVLRYERTGWADNGRFLIPGRPQSGIEILLKRKLPYRVDEGADLRLGLVALDKLLESMTPERATVVAAVAFQAPLARLADWANERYSVFIAGRSGSLKTTFAQTLMCLYGPDFADDTLLTKWGEGATNNALMGIASIPHDLPFLIDNFKPNTGGGANAFVALIHNIVEGGEKERMNRAAELRETKPLHCWPICTGEDVPDGDPASLARILVVPFLWQSGEDNEPLSEAQELSMHMCAVGNAWIAWLETDDGQEVVAAVAAKFKEYRSRWSGVLRGIRKDSVNILRVASNLATNQLAWEIVCEHPTIGPLARKHAEAHSRGLSEIVATTMAEATAEALEATRYLAAIRELVAVEQAFIPSMGAVVSDREKQKLIGWKDDGKVYLMPSVTRRAVEVLIGNLNGVSTLSLNKQLDALGAIADSDKGRFTKNKRVNGKVEVTLCLYQHVLEGDEHQTGAEIAVEIEF